MSATPAKARDTEANRLARRALAALIEAARAEGADACLQTREGWTLFYLIPRQGYYVVLAGAPEKCPGVLLLRLGLLARSPRDHLTSRELSDTLRGWRHWRRDLYNTPRKRIERRTVA